jgi:hypothetical protein
VKTTRPGIVRLEQLGSVARESVALAMAERVKRFGPRNALFPSTTDPFTTTGLYPTEPDPFAPSEPFIAN